MCFPTTAWMNIANPTLLTNESKITQITNYMYLNNTNFEK